MRTPFSNLVLDSALPAPAAESFFLAGPSAAGRKPVSRLKHQALLADIRRQSRQGRRQRVAA